MSDISKKALSEVELLREIYKKLAGESPALDLNKALSKAQLLRGIAEVAKPIPDEYVPEGPTIVADIPTTLLPGQKVWCVATQSEWIGADPDNGIFPTLVAGTPFPTVGFKRLYFSFYYDTTVFVKTYKNEIGTFNLTRAHQGEYHILGSTFSSDNNTEVQANFGHPEEAGWILANSDNGDYIPHGVFIKLFDSLVSPMDPGNYTRRIFVQIFIFPPVL